MANRIKAVRRTCANCRFCDSKEKYCNRFRCKLKKLNPCTSHCFNNAALDVVEEYIKGAIQEVYHG